MQVLSSLNSKHIIKLVETIKTPRNYYMMVEYCNGADLDTLFDAGLKLNEK
jgi:serine/threonine protein kinase